MKTTINRGTTQIQVNSCPVKTTGILFQKCQVDHMATLPPTTVLSTRRGTTTMKVSEYPKINSKTPNWGFIITSRGTGVRKL